MTRPDQPADTIRPDFPPYAIELAHAIYEGLRGSLWGDSVTREDILGALVATGSPHEVRELRDFLAHRFPALPATLTPLQFAILMQGVRYQLETGQLDPDEAQRGMEYDRLISRWAVERMRGIAELNAVLSGLAMLQLQTDEVGGLQVVLARIRVSDFPDWASRAVDLGALLPEPAGEPERGAVEDSEPAPEPAPRPVYDATGAPVKLVQ